MVYWLGKSTLFLPKAVRGVLTDEVEFAEVEDDISVTSIPGETLFFFYVDSFKSNSNLLLSMKICINLSKKMILIHHGEMPPLYVNNDVVYAAIDLSSSEAIEQTLMAIRSLQKDRLIECKDTKKHLSYNTSESRPYQTDKNTAVIENALAYIDHRFSGNLRESEVAERCHFSTQHFSRIFHSIVGYSFRDYLTQKRLEHAKSLLLNRPNSTITDIAYQCGYSDVSYFSRIFKQKIGTSPGNYRFEHVGRNVSIS